MHVHGRCHCGKVTYEAEVDPNGVSLCHCTDCQVLCGSPYRASVAAPTATFRLTGAAPKIYVKIAESGNRRAQAFCSDCGSPIYASDVDAPSVFNLRLGSVIERAALAPHRQIWHRSALPWAEDIRALPASDRNAKP